MMIFLKKGEEITICNKDSGKATTITYDDLDR